MPWTVRVLLRSVLSEARRQDVLGDLHEVQADRCERLGRLPAWLLTTAEGFWLAAVFLTLRLASFQWSGLRISSIDLRLAARLLRKQPLMAGTTVLALGAGLGIATTGFGVISGIFGSELPYVWGDRMVRLEARTEREGFHRSLELEHYHLLQSAEVFDHLGAEDTDSISVLHPSGDIESVRGSWMTPSTFARLPYEPLLGRALASADGSEGAPPVVLLRESFWRRSFSASETLVGETLHVAGVDRLVVGVLPDTARFPSEAEMWLPLDDRRLGGVGERPKPGLEYFAILREEQSLEASAARINDLFARLDTVDSTTRVVLSDYTSSAPEEVAAATTMLGVLVALLLVIASNVANLTLTRTCARSEELSLRTALGAARSRLIAQLAGETALLGGLALLLGLFISREALRWLEPRLEYVPFWMDLTLSPRTVLFAVVLALFACAVGGLMPALRATSGRVRSRSFSLSRTGSAMMVAELATSIVLLCAAVSISLSLVSDQRAQSPLPTKSILTTRLTAPNPVSSSNESLVEERGPLGTRVLSAADEMPGVIAAAISRRALHRPGPSRRVESEGIEAQSATVRQVSPGFFRLAETGLLEGRMLQTRDLVEGAARTAVVDQHFAKRFLGASAVGRRIRFEAPAGEEPGPWIEVVGVVASSTFERGRRSTGEIYLPWAGDGRSLFLMVRTEGDPTHRAGELWQSFAALDLGLQVSAVRTLEEVSRDERALLAAFAKALVGAGLMVLLLSTVSLYAVTSFGVTRRRKEIGVRLSLGATHGSILRTVLASSSSYLFIGGLLGAGLVVVADALGLLESLFALRSPPHLAWLLPWIVVTLLVAGVVATLFPARRALRIHPAEALRRD